MGGKRRICTRCYRYMLMKMWEKKQPEEQESILVFPARPGLTGCATFYDVQKIYNNIN